MKVLNESTTYVYEIKFDITSDDHIINSKDADKVKNRITEMINKEFPDLRLEGKVISRSRTYTQW